MGHTSTSKGGEKEVFCRVKWAPEELWEPGWACPYVESKSPV